MRCASLHLQLTRHFIQAFLAALCMLLASTGWSANSAEEITVEIKDTERLYYASMQKASI